MQMRCATDHQHGNHRDVSELARHTAVNDIGEAAMSVGRHRNEVALLTLGARCNLLCRIAAGENRFCLVALLLESVGHRLDVLAVALHLFGFAEIELIDVARGPSIGDVYQHDRRVIACARQLPYVIQYHFVVVRMLDGNEYALVHQLTGPRKNWSSSQMLSPAITNATV